MTPLAPQEHKTKEAVQITNHKEAEYEAPSLIEYGRVSELTNGTGTMNLDLVANRRKN